MSRLCFAADVYRPPHFFARSDYLDSATVARVYNVDMGFRSQSSPLTKKGKTPPPEETFEEAAYLKWLGEKQKSVTVKLTNGEVVRGWVEYYDRNMVRLTREGAPNLFIFKHQIMYISEGGPAPRKSRADATKPSAVSGSNSADSE